MLEGEQILINFGMSWSEFWLRLEEIKSSMAYQDRLLLYKNFGGGKLPFSGFEVLLLLLLLQGGGGSDGCFFFSETSLGCCFLGGNDQR